MSSMEDVLASQQQLLNAIENVYTKFKKDGADRKTSDYIRRRLDTLDKYWQEFESNHITLCGLEYARGHSYFSNKQFDHTKDRYEIIRSAISNYQSRDDRPSTPVHKPATALGVPGPSQQQAYTKAQGTSSKTDEMLRKQSTNFKAFEHTVSNINLETVSEKWEFDHLLRTIQSRWSIIDTLHWELDSELEGRNPDYESAFFEYEGKYNSIIKSINRKLCSLSHREQSTPQVEIPTFSGNYHQWSSFKDLFIETIHSNPSLSSAQKMQFLKTKVKGEAERLIQHLPITSDNYLISWDILNNRYNNKSLIFRSHIDQLLNIPVTQQISVNHIKRIHDTTLETLNAVKNLGVDVSSWDPLLVYLLSQKLDADTYNGYIASVKQARELPKLQEFLSFLENKFTSLEASRKTPENYTNKLLQFNTDQSPHKWNKYQRNFNTQAFPAHNSHNSQQSKNNYCKFFKCGLCKSNDHCLYYCRKFLSLTPYQKRRTVTQLQICENCLYSHNGKQCISEKRCMECQQNHNTLLHQAFSQPDSTNNMTHVSRSPQPESSQQLNSNSHVSLQHDTPEILLATAILKVQKYDGSFINMRALIDQGSQTSLITEHAAQILGQPRLRCRGVISGIGAKESNCKGVVSITCQSLSTNFEFKTEAYIMKSLIKNLPNYSFTKPSWTYLEYITLADPEFYISRPVDILLGADIYSTILLEGICRPNDSIPIAQNTRLGWILTGNVKSLQCNVIINNLEEIQKFWEIEDISEESNNCSENQQCVEYYKSTTTRREDGRYEVRLPMLPDFQTKLGDSKSKAIAQFKSLENKLNKQTNIGEQYKLFINEYRALGHMIPANGNLKPEYFNTHHCVQSNDPIKFRVVFNASSKTSTGMSLNDVMECGPNLQQDLQSLILKWRQYQFAFTADIEKMFRQIWVHPEDQKLLKIIWRDSASEPIKQYQLTTVTYGTKAAPFLAMMTLKQLASDESTNYQYSKAIEVLENSFYMDDLVHGCHSIETAKRLQIDLINLLKSGGFHLRKWKSNLSELLPDIECEQANQEDFNFKQIEHSKTLGLAWNPEKDLFTFTSRFELQDKPTTITKRILLSDISKLFDPLGWLSPLSTKLKLLFQQVWAANINWDDALPENIYKEWIKIKEDMNSMKDLILPRWLRTQESDTIELHGFSDASMKAYGCVIYCRVNIGNRSSVVLVAVKARLVPKSKAVTLPRLELSGVLLLSKLMHKVKQCLSSHNIKVYGWVDSMVVLGWLNGESSRWKTFVANRVRAITNVMSSDCWRYVKSEENPADCVSRGLTASQLREHSLWWQGPAWLTTLKDESGPTKFSTEQEMRSPKRVYSIIQHENIIETILSKCSSFNRAVREIAWMRRFMCRMKKQLGNYLSMEEMKNSILLIIKNIQEIDFTKKYADSQTRHKIQRKCKICELHPYFDEDHLLRVGGRLRHANLDPDMTLS